MALAASVPEAVLVYTVRHQNGWFLLTNKLMTNLELPKGVNI